jgi:hypothetical protein
VIRVLDRVVLRALVAIALATGIAHAETIVELPDTPTQLVLDDAWHQIETKGAQPVAAYRHEAGLVLAVTRADTPNADAWIGARKQAYADAVERGIRDALPGYKRLSKRLVDAAGIPVLDVEARRAGGATVVLRVLLYRTYALSLAIEVPAGGDVGIARRLALEFAPPPLPPL